jgi:hypothetical protein
LLSSRGLTGKVAFGTHLVRVIELSLALDVEDPTCSYTAIAELATQLYPVPPVDLRVLIPGVHGASMAQLLISTTVRGCPRPLVSRQYDYPWVPKSRKLPLPKLRTRVRFPSLALGKVLVTGGFRGVTPGG